MSEQAPNAVRLDKWLWAARFFKTRSLAVDAIKKGQVRLGGERAKPGRGLRIGERLQVQKGELSFDVEVMALSDRRGPAREAQQLYRETDASRAAREAAAAQRRAARLSAPTPPPGRPDKHARKRIRRLLGK